MLHSCMNWTPATPVSSRPGSFHPLPASLNSIGPAFFTRSSRSCNQERFTSLLQSRVSALLSKMPGVWGISSQTLRRTTSKPLTSLFSSSCTLFCPTVIPQLSYFQRFVHSFYRDGGCRGIRPTNCDARNPFRPLHLRPPFARGIRFYENTQVAYALLPRISGNALAALRPVSAHNGRIPGGFLRRSEMSNKMRTWIVFSLVGMALVCGQAAGAQQEPDWSKVQIKVTKVSGNIYMLEGQGGNIAASVGEDGIVIVDDQFAPLAEKIQAALKELKLTDKPVRFVINTHYHGDHTGG